MKLKKFGGSRKLENDSWARKWLLLGSLLELGVSVADQPDDIAANQD